mgnify:FL=1|jgi:hypothetical protein
MMKFYLYLFYMNDLRSSLVNGVLRYLPCDFFRFFKW